MTGTGGAVAVGDSEPRAHVREVVGRSGTSFLWSMRVLPKARREAMYAVYAFCREVDDIADEPGDVDARRARLAEWRSEIARLYEDGAVRHPIARALAGPITTYRLPRGPFLAIIDGMEMDLTGRMCAPTWEELELYCRRVAGAVGEISVRVFGAHEPEAERLAIALGEALQLTNILRDLAEDAGRGRLYLPRERLEAHGITAREPQAVLADPRVGAVCAEIAARARARFDESRALLAYCEPRALKPCIFMMGIYGRYLERLEARGWNDVLQPVSVSTAEKLWIVLRHAFA